MSRTTTITTSVTTLNASNSKLITTETKTPFTTGITILTTTTTTTTAIIPKPTTRPVGQVRAGKIPIPLSQIIPIQQL